MKKRPQRTFESITEYLEYHELTQSAFAEQFGISIGYLSDLKSGKQTPSLALAKRFRDECHIPIEAFLTAKAS